MPIEQIWIKNYRALQDVKLTNLPRLAVVIGANGTGKSTLFDVFSFLKDALAGNVASAVAKRGGFKELVSRGSDGPIGITVKFRESSGRLATYLLEVAETGGRPVVRHEVLRYRRFGGGRPWHFVAFREGSGNAITNESMYGAPGVSEERREYKLDDPATLAIKGLGQFQEFRVVSEFRSLIDNWHISNLHIADARSSSEVGYAEHLSTSGENVAQVAQYLYEHHPKHFQRVLRAMRDRVPGVTAVEAKPTEDGRLVLRFQDGTFKDPFVARHVSDGTIKMFAYLLLLHDPHPHPLIAVKEPENQLYHDLLSLLTEEFRDYARRGGQAFVSTHSPDFLNGAELSEIYWFEKVDGFARVRRAKDSKLLRDLYDGGDPPGALWRQRLLGGEALDDAPDASATVRPHFPPSASIPPSLTRHVHHDW